MIQLPSSHNIIFHSSSKQKESLTFFSSAYRIVSYRINSKSDPLCVLRYTTLYVASSFHRSRDSRCLSTWQRESFVLACLSNQPKCLRLVTRVLLYAQYTR